MNHKHDPQTDQLLRLAVDIMNALHYTNQRMGTSFEIRIGIHVGPVNAGVLGTSRFCYDLWGDSTNIAARMESSGEAGKIHLSEDAYAQVKHMTDEFNFIDDGFAEIKGKGQMRTFYAEPLGRTPTTAKRVPLQ